MMVVFQTKFFFFFFFLTRMITVYFLYDAFSSANQPKFLQIWSNQFLHHIKASVFTLVALLSLDQDRLFYKYSQNHCKFLYLGLFFHYLSSLKQIESTLNFKITAKSSFEKKYLNHFMFSSRSTIILFCLCLQCSWLIHKEKMKEKKPLHCKVCD